METFLNKKHLQKETFAKVYTQKVRSQMFDKVLIKWPMFLKKSATKISEKSLQKNCRPVNFS